MPENVSLSIICMYNIVVGALQKEVAALEELSRQLFMEYVDMLGVRVSMIY